MDDIDDEAWQIELTLLMAATLREFRGTIDSELAMFAVDCHPWDGTIALAFLTRPEAEDDPLLRDPAEMAAWRYYDFGVSLASWRTVSGVASAMRDAYARAGDGRHDVARRFLRGCAAAATSEEVRGVLAQFRRAEGFAISISDPDTGEEFNPPK